MTRTPADWGEWADLETDRIHRAGQWHAPRSFDPSDPQGIVSFASNDYLGLTHHPAVMQAAHDAIDRWGTGAGAARLIVGSRPVHDELEAALAAWKHTEAAVLFATGLRRQSRCARYLRRTGRGRRVRRAQPRVPHRRSTPVRRAARGVPAR